MTKDIFCRTPGPAKSSMNPHVPTLPDTPICPRLSLQSGQTHGAFLTRFPSKTSQPLQLDHPTNYSPSVLGGS